MPTCIDVASLLREQLKTCEAKSRAKDERICQLETENAMLHIKMAQLQGSLKKTKEDNLILRELFEREVEQRKDMRLCALTLMEKVKSLREELDAVRAEVKNFPKLAGEECRKVALRSERHRQVFALQKSNITELQQMLLTADRNVQAANERHLVEKRRRKQLHNSLMELRGNIRVHCRVRPVLDFDGPGQEASDLGRPGTVSEVIVGALDDENVCLRTPKGNRVFEYDRVFTPNEGQSSVFEEVQPLLTSLLDGYNVCIMAYGQTGSGKTHTMLGSHRNDMYTLSADPHPGEGVIPRATRELFGLIKEKSEQDYSVEMSVIEIYNNDVRDLLSGDQTTKHEIITGSDGSMCMPSVTVRPVHDVTNVMELVKHGLRTRRETATLIHEHSSRSHLVVILTVTLTLAVPLSPRQSQSYDGFLVPPSPTSRDRPRRLLPEPRLPNFGGSQIPVSSPKTRSPSPSAMLQSGSSNVIKTKLQLVDLAGSECVGMSGVTGVALRETSNINKSLSALADVLGALAEHRQHVPYRNSKITHLLQDSIGGDAKLMVLLCVSPAHRYLTETHQCLGFGQRARQVQRGPPKRKVPAGLEKSGHVDTGGRNSPRPKPHLPVSPRPSPSRALIFD